MTTEPGSLATGANSVIPEGRVAKGDPPLNHRCFRVTRDGPGRGPRGGDSVVPRRDGRGARSTCVSASSNERAW